MTYKDRAALPAQPDLLRALTGWEKARPRCRWFHRWVKIVAVETWPYTYRQCLRCCDRDAIYRYRGGHAPANGYWLNGGSWEDPRIRNMPTTKGPISAVPPRPPT